MQNTLGYELKISKIVKSLNKRKKEEWLNLGPLVKILEPHQTLSGKTMNSGLNAVRRQLNQPLESRYLCPVELTTRTQALH